MKGLCTSTWSLAALDSGRRREPRARGSHLCHPSENPPPEKHTDRSLREILDPLHCSFCHIFPYFALLSPKKPRSEIFPLAGKGCKSNAITITLRSLQRPWKRSPVPALLCLRSTFTFLALVGPLVLPTAGPGPVPGQTATSESSLLQKRHHFQQSRVYFFILKTQGLKRHWVWSKAPMRLTQIDNERNLCIGIFASPFQHLLWPNFSSVVFWEELHWGVFPPQLRYKEKRIFLQHQWWKPKQENLDNVGSFSHLLQHRNKSELDLDQQGRSIIWKIMC